MTVEGTRQARPSEEDRWHLGDERDFLRRSLEDADREHEAGDLSDEDHAVLVARDSARLAEVEAELATVGPAVWPDDDRRVAAPPDATLAPDHPAADGGGTRPPMARWRKIVVVVACLLIVLGAGILVDHFVQAREPGQASSGSVSLSQAEAIEQQLQEALARNNEGDTKGALELYDKVLSEDPSNPAALAYAGYIQWDVGSSAHVPSLVRVGRSMIETAVRNSPSYYEAHLFDGLVLENQDHNDRAAVAQFDDFLADGPPAAEPPQVAALVVPAYQAAGVPLPAAFSGSTGTTSGTRTGASAP